MFAFTLFQCAFRWQCRIFRIFKLLHFHDFGISVLYFACCAVLLCVNHILWLFSNAIYSCFTRLFNKICVNSCYLLSVFAFNTASSVYLKYLIFCPPLINPDKTSSYLRMALLQRWNTSGETAHPWLTPISIFL